MSLNRVSRQDNGTLAKVEPTPSGGLRISAFVTRTGIFEYDLPNGRKRREYRPDSEVFNPESLNTLSGAPLTNDHPPTPVNADNWKTYSIGHVSDYVTREGEHVSTRINVLDSAAIKDVAEERLKELSAGYSCELDETPGTAPDGSEYDAVQRQIKYNHVAIGPAGWGRAGNTVALRLDSNLNQIPSNGDSDMTTKRNDAESAEQNKTDELPEDAVANLQAAIDEVRAMVEELKAQVEDKPAEEKPADESAEEKSDEESEEEKSDESDTEEKQDSSTKEMVIAALEKLGDDFDADDLWTLVDEIKSEKIGAAVESAASENKEDEPDEEKRMDARVNELVELREKARSILGPKFTLDGKSPTEIRKAVIGKVMPKVRLDGKSDDYLAGQFAAACELVERKQDTPAPTVREDGDSDPYKTYESNLSNAWKGKAKK